MTEESTHTGSRVPVLAAALAFLFLTPLLTVQLRAEWGQVAVTLLAAGCLGFYLGHARSGRGFVTFVTYGAILGALLWIGLLIAAQVFYPGYTVFPGTWFVRFGLGSALVLTAAALFGDQSARGKSTLTITLLATLIGIVGSLLTIIRGGG